jgi:hypothetical protein
MSFLFVGGAQRSGTTVLQKFLCLDARTSPKIAEASYLRTLLQAYRQAKDDFQHDTRDYFADHDDLRRFHAGLIYLFLNRTLARMQGSDMLVLKEPHMTMLFADLFELVPEARFVVTMRDPRDIMASMIDVGRRMQQQGQNHFFQQRDIEQLSNYIKSFYAPLLNSKDPAFRDRFLIIRYEDLISHTDDVRERLRAFTGLALDFAASGIVSIVQNHDAALQQPRYRPWYTDNENAPLNASSIGRYADVLDTDEIAAAERHCEDLLTLFRYHVA